MEGSKAFDLLLFLTEQARKHDEDVDSIRLQLQTHSVQLTSIHELLLSMRPLKSDPPLHEWSSPPPPLLPLTETLPPPLHPLYQQQDPPSLTTAPSLPILSNLPSLKKSPSSIPLSKDGPLDLKELRRSLQGAGQQAFGSQSNPLFPPADQPPPPPHQETSASKQSLPAVDQELEGEARFSEKTALLVDHKNQPQDRHPQGNGNGNSETLGAYSDGDVAMKVSSELQSRVQQNDPHGFMGFLYLVKEVLWGGLLLPHQKNIWDVFICVLLLWVAFGTPMVICFGLKADLLQGHPLGCRSRWRIPYLLLPLPPSLLSPFLPLPHSHPLLLSLTLSSFLNHHITHRRRD